MKHPGAMDSPEFSLLSSLRGEFKPEDYIQPHYKESYRQAIDCLVKNGRDSYREFLKGERIGSFLSEDELVFITSNAETPPPRTHTEDTDGPSDNQSSSGTYWPLHSDVETPDLDLGWPDFPHNNLQTNIDLLFHPPRQNSPTIKEVIRKHIQDARQVVAIAMDTFTDVDIFKEVIDASVRGVPVYVLLDHFHLKHFLTMAENQDVKIPQLRNMRVRTVKGQDYLCRSGAKFHGAMEQKFLLVDCHTAIYGSYSFTWSFEKINLSMVQVIKGHLVKLYDEEFRTLYARSTVPAQLCPPEGSFQHNGPQGRQVLPKLHSGQKLERNDLLRHTLDNVFRKTCDRKLGLMNLEEKLLEEEPNGIRPLVENGIKGKQELHMVQCSEMMNLQKRHSYAGERQDSCVPQNIRSRASHWNISRDTGTGPNNPNMDVYLQVPHTYRGQNMCQSYNDSDKPILSIQQNVPTLENTSKSFMRNWRIESYLKNSDDPFQESTDYLDQIEQMDKHGSFMQSRTRSSFGFRPSIPEHMEPKRHMNLSADIVPQPATHTPLHYTSMQWSPTAAGDSRANEEFMLKRQSLQILDDNHYDAYFGPGRNSHQTFYASLGRNKGGHMMTNPDLLTDGWQKRHSLADPRSNTEYAPEPSGHMYGAFARMQINRNAAGFNARNDGHLLSLNEDQRSVSHFDVMNMTSKNWQETPSRTLSAAALEENSKDLTGKPNSSQNYSKKLATRINSLINIPENKEDSFGTTGTPSLKSTGSTDTITAEDEEKASVEVENPRPNRSYLVRSASEHQDHRHKIEQNSKSHLTSDEPRHTRQLSLPKTSRYKKPTLLDKSPKPSFDTGSLKRNKAAESRLYSRFEGTLHNTHTQDKHFTKTDASAGPHLGRTLRGHHENKLEKFFQRVGNFIHKNK